MKKILTMLLTVGILATGCNGVAEEKQKDNLQSSAVKQEEEGLKIISTAPSNTEVLIGLGVGEQIIGVDNYSPTEELNSDIMIIDFFNFDAEKLIEMDPDIIFSAETNYVGSENPFQLIEDTGIKVIKVPTSTSISHISDTIIIIGQEIGKVTEATAIVEELEKEIDEIRKIGETITDKKNVYIEIGDYSGVLYTSGKNTFLDDAINIVGANNIFEDLDSWVAISGEVVVDKNPDIIITNNSYVENIVDIIKNRQGFESIDAVKNEEIRLVNVDTTSRGSQNIILGIREIAEALYPEVYNFEK